MKMKRDKAIVLLSGGLDSSVVLFTNKEKYECHCLGYDYGQRHNREIKSAEKIAAIAGCDYKIVRISFPWKGSPLIDKSKKIPYNDSSGIGKSIPSTYVPGRNTVFLSYALSFAETIGAKKILIGVNAVDYSGYPDCRPEYYKYFNKMLSVGTRDRNIKIETPIIYKTKKDIVKLGLKYAVPLELTWSCYSGEKKPCGKCDACVLRAKGFSEANMEDPLL
ncbi:MAG: 7-cyano-7-deazaguanine synthase QueC [Elusimicrobia bacterium]|nr:7-cyano-7-deazaguanine synthase QueC [Elusimicrobiota bacterium]